MKVEILRQVLELEALVESENVDGAFYKVKCSEDVWSCSCPSFQKRKVECKHIIAVKEEV